MRRQCDCGWTPSKKIGRPAHFQEYAQKAASPDLAARFFAASWGPWGPVTSFSLSNYSSYAELSKA